MQRRVVGPLVCIIVSMIPVMMVAAGGIAIATTVAILERDYPIEIRVLDNCFEQVADAEPQRIFIVCTTQAGVTTCRARDLTVRADPNASN